MAAGARAWHKAAIFYRSERCLAACAPHVGCLRCVEVCPTRCLRHAGHQIEADAGCIACGRCAAACPTEAINAAEFRLDLDHPASAEPVIIACRRVPPADVAASATRVPCLGGLSPGMLLELRSAAGERPIHLIELDGCRSCAAGGSEHPVRSALQQVSALLAAMGALDRTPLLISRPAVRGRRRPKPGNSIVSPTRRALLRPLARTGADTAQPVRPPARSPRVQLPLEPRAGRRMHAALGRLAVRWGASVPRSFYPVVTIGEACGNHQVCVRVCPTGALTALAEAGAVSVVFDNRLCIACGACARLCPERAPTLKADGRPEPAAAAGPRPLTRHRRRACRDCGQPFAEPGDSMHCPACRKTQAFARAGFALRFQGAPPHEGGLPG